MVQVHGHAGRGSWKLVAAVDTGASKCMIPLRAARLLGYPVDSAQRQRVVMGGSVAKAPAVVLDRVDVGPASARGVEAICHDLPKESMLDALVGLSFLTKFDLAFDFEAWEMELVPRAG